MKAQDLTAIILAGGKGSRLKPYDDPKCILKVHGKPILQHLRDHLWASGCGGMIVCTGYKAAKVEAVICAWSDKYRNCTVWSDAGENASMTDRIIKAVDSHDLERALICYGDEIADVSIVGLLQAHADRGRQKLATVTLYPLKSEFGIFKSKPGETEHYEFHDKPIIWDHYVNIGWCIMEKAALMELQPGEGLSDALNRLNTLGQLGFYHHRGMRLTINTLQDLEEAENALRS
jgi:NDP-sugar pyrophosphorylase family protein